MVAQYLKSLFHVLDYGFVLYRKHFLQFFTLAALLLVLPIAALWILYAFSSRFIGGFSISFILLGLIASWPWFIYSLLVLSKACQVVVQGQEFKYRSVFTISIGRLIIACIFAAIIMAILFSSSYLTSVFTSLFTLIMAGSIFGMFSNAAGGMQVFQNILSSVLFTALFFSVFTTSICSGGVMISILYYLQAWVVPEYTINQSINHSFSSYFYKFFHNFQIWALAAMIFYVINYIYIICLFGSSAFASILFGVSGFDTPVFYVLVGLYLIVTILMLPLGIIWMSQLYLHNTKQQQGLELQQRLYQWNPDLVQTN